MVYKVVQYRGKELEEGLNEMEALGWEMAFINAIDEDTYFIYIVTYHKNN